MSGEFDPELESLPIDPDDDDPDEIAAAVHAEANYAYEEQTDESH